MLISAGSVLLGYAMLFAVAYLVQRPLLLWTAPLLGASWMPTAQLALACCSLGAAGWLIGWTNRRWASFHPLSIVLVFAVLLEIWNFGLVPAASIPWLLRLLLDSVEDSRYLDSFVTSLATDVLLFGSLMGGAILSRAREQPRIHLFPPST